MADLFMIVGGASIVILTHFCAFVFGMKKCIEWDMPAELDEEQQALAV